MRALASLLIILTLGAPILADDSTPSDGAAHNNVKVVSVAPLEHIDTDGRVTGVTMSTPNTLYTLVKYISASSNGKPEVILADSQNQQYRIELKATDYSPPPPLPTTNIVVTPPSVVPAATVPPQPPAPAVTSSSDPVPGSDNIVRSPHAYSFHAPPGWKIRTAITGLVTVCDMVGEHDCVATISICSIPNDDSLKKFAQDQRDTEKMMQSKANCQIEDLQPFTTDSGWEGLMFAETVTSNGNKQLHYYFSGKGDTKIIFGTLCHIESVDHYTPLFNAATKSLVLE